MKVAFPSDYRRCTLGRRSPSRALHSLSVIAGTPPAASAPALWELIRERVPCGLDRARRGANRLFVRPVVGIETHQLLGESVAILRRTGAPRYPLQELVVAAPQPRGLNGAKGAAKKRLVFDDHRRWRLARRSASPGLRPVCPVGPIARIRTRERRLSHERVPVERQVRMRVLQRLAHLGLDRVASDFQARGRPEDIQHASPGAAIGASVRVHYKRALIPTFVTRVANERQRSTSSSCLPSSSASLPWAWRP
jgi:hypothetical protein